MACPHCGDTRTYTDPQPKQRCIRCLAPNGSTAGTPNGAMHDDEAPMVIVGTTRTYTYTVR